MQRREERGAQTLPLPRRIGAAVAAGAGVVALSGCGESLTRGYLPEPATEVGADVVGFWNATWIAALAVGVVVWFLILWAVFAYRRRSEDEVPVQFRYHVPFEILYTVVPIFMVAAMFGQTVNLQNAMLDTEPEPDVVVNVVGKKWSWDFNYVEEQVFVSGEQAGDLNDGQEGVPDTLPTLVLPVDSRVEFVLTSRDVIHSFWVVNFLQKMDMVPGRVNIFQVTTTEEGTFAGKCAELCGAYHSEMLFQVEVVSQEEYDTFIADLEESGNTGQLGPDLDLYELQPDQQDKLPEGVEN
ncbi:aa3-type cytochrome oxidase subunit II [Serinicoccus kebangsaanensis]|uniref:aa3-type cytochrome oxidase subunit II n=1 Tax=Serinicoccus kebangsaanensis TaxID=2602069 RepID=UPI00124D60BC|nr:cytochrome c oxidase subunit II [Serinicoccus kebangsaanensis]